MCRRCIQNLISIAALFPLNFRMCVAFTNCDSILSKPDTPIVCLISTIRAQNKNNS